MDGLGVANPSLAGFRLKAKRSFRTFNTGIEVTLADWPEAWRTAQIEGFFKAFEARFSRFLPTSEVSSLNSRTQPEVRVSPDLMGLLVRCQEFHRLTGGIFNPLILDALEGAGYDRSFEQLDTVPNAAATAMPVFPFGDVDLDPGASVVSAPVGVHFDFGGIGKGYAVDEAAAMLGDCPCGFLINAGGDIFASGRNELGQPWQIAVADARSPDQTLTMVWLSDQAIATSWTVKRRWQTATGWANHLIDSRSGIPVASGVIGATVVAASATEADVFAKTALILGPQEGIAFLEEHRAAGLLVQENGSLVSTADWPGELLGNKEGVAR